LDPRQTLVISYSRAARNSNFGRRRHSGNDGLLARQKNRVYVVQITSVPMPEFTNLRFEIDQFKTMWKAVVYMLNMFVMDPVPVDKACLYAVKNRLLDSGYLGVFEEVPRHAGSRDAMPKPGRPALG
jgi:hypothetical protein